MPTAALLPSIQLAPPSFRTKPQTFALLGRIRVVFPHKAADAFPLYVFPQKAPHDIPPYVFPHKAADNARSGLRRPHLWLCAERREVSRSAGAVGRLELRP